MTKTIQDTGEFLPKAKKHQYTKNTLTNVNLKSLWPEPNWLDMIKDGIDINVVSVLYVFYKNIRPSPRPKCKRYSDEKWAYHFEKTIFQLKSIFENFRNIQNLNDLKDKFCELNGLSKNINLLGIEQKLPFYACGKGLSKRKYSSPFELSNKDKQLVKWLPTLNWPENKLATKANMFPYETNNGQWVLAKYNKTRYQWKNDDVYQNRDAAISEFIKRFTLGTQNNKPYNPQKKVNLSYQEGLLNKNVLPEDIIDEFGFRTIQFGRSMSDNQRQLWLNNAYHALNVFADVIGVKNKKWLGLEGVALAFGARGHGKAMAHYEPKLRAINMTFKNGEGCFVHEWFHALDHKMGTVFKHKKKYYATQISHRYIPEHWKNLELGEHYEILKSFWDFRLHGCNQSSFINQARALACQKGGRKYWSKIIEVYARSFEAYIQDKLEKLGLDCPWLVSGTKENDYDANYSKMHPFPLGHERERLNGLWDVFINQLPKE